VKYVSNYLAVLINFINTAELTEHHAVVDFLCVCVSYADIVLKNNLQQRGEIFPRYFSGFTGPVFTIFAVNGRCMIVHNECNLYMIANVTLQYSFFFRNTGELHKWLCVYRCGLHYDRHLYGASGLCCVGWAWQAAAGVCRQSTLYRLYLLTH